MCILISLRGDKLKEMSPWFLCVFFTFSYILPPLWKIKCLMRIKSTKSYQKSSSFCIIQLFSYFLYSSNAKVIVKATPLNNGEERQSVAGGDDNRVTAFKPATSWNTHRSMMISKRHSANAERNLRIYWTWFPFLIPNWPNHFGTNEELRRKCL